MIYTKTGDTGTTSLVGGARVSKDDARVDAYGTVDELNSHVGMLAAMLRSEIVKIDAEASNLHLRQLMSVQNKLFVLQTMLATESEEMMEKIPRLKESDITALEQWIDSIQEALPTLSSFVMVGSTVASSQAHVARCVCRRAERTVVSLARNYNVDPLIQQYLNRLSDYLFVFARKLVQMEHKNEIFWKAE